MLIRDDNRINSRHISIHSQAAVEKPEHCEDFKACLVQALKILEERYEV
jgi:hypothetical protein